MRWNRASSRADDAMMLPVRYVCEEKTYLFTGAEAEEDDDAQDGADAQDDERAAAEEPDSELEAESEDYKSRGRGGKNSHITKLCCAR